MTNSVEVLIIVLDLLIIGLVVWADSRRASNAVEKPAGNGVEPNATDRFGAKKEDAPERRHPPLWHS